MCIAPESIAPSLRSEAPATRPTIQRILHDNWRAFAGKSPMPKYTHRADIGLALHAWSQTLSAHPHVHFIVTFGGLASDGTWKTPKKDCLLPRHVLMSMFRGKFLDKLRKLVISDKVVLPDGWTKGKCLSLLNQLGRAPWNVKLPDQPFFD